MNKTCLLPMDALQHRHHHRKRFLLLELLRFFMLYAIWILISQQYRCSRQAWSIDRHCFKWGIHLADFKRPTNFHWALFYWLSFNALFLSFDERCNISFIYYFHYGYQKIIKIMIVWITICSFFPSWFKLNTRFQCAVIIEY